MSSPIGNPGAYEEIDDASRDHIDYDIPQGFSVHGTLHPTPPFETGITVSTPPFAAIAFSYHSKPELLTNVPVEKQQTITPYPQLPNLSGLPTLPQCLPKQYYLSATFDAERTLQADYVHRYNKNLEWRLYGVTLVTNVKESEATLNLKYTTEKNTTQLKLSSDNKLVGANYLHKLPRNWVAGGEFLYALSESSFAFSVGARYRTPNPTAPTTWAMTANSMGELAGSCTTNIIPNSFSVSTRYGINVNNYQSDFALGASYSFGKSLPMSVKARVDARGDVGLMASFFTRYGRLYVGATHNNSKKEMSMGAHFEICNS